MFRLFGLFRKPRKASATSDIEETYLRTFGDLMKASRDPEILTKRMSVVIALSSTMGAMRDLYPELVEDESIAIALIEANAARDYEGADELCEAILSFADSQKQHRTNRIYAVCWMIAPKRAKKVREAGMPVGSPSDGLGGS
jgi:hypothetical protein